MTGSTTIDVDDGARLSSMSEGVNDERRRFSFALLLSLLLHAPLLALTAGGTGIGLPGFDFPWRDRRSETSELRVVLVPPEAPAAAPATTPAVQSPTEGLPSGAAAASSLSPAQPPAENAKALAVLPAPPLEESESNSEPAPVAAPAIPPVRAAGP
ncbi:MAG: hypothetical protein WBA53_03510, partial [Burkholderiaceae bacterium]